MVLLSWERWDCVRVRLSVGVIGWGGVRVRICEGVLGGRGEKVSWEFWRIVVFGEVVVGVRRIGVGWNGNVGWVKEGVGCEV